MCVFQRVVRRVVLVGVMLAAGAAVAAERLPFREARFEQGELKYIEGIPVLVVQGTPEQIGRQKAVLTAEVVKLLADYPKQLLKRFGREDRWPKLVAKSRLLLPQFPPDHRAELKAFAAASGMPSEVGVVANTMLDIYRGGLGCSSLIVEAGRSKTGGPLFGRNLDFYTLGILDKYNLVTIHRPEGKHAFASVGFPGLCGCVSGINDAGLALAVHEVFISRDRSPLFNPEGVPYTLCFRRILEECATVQEAEALLRKTKRTTLLNLVVCDRQGGAVLEMTPKHVVRRLAEDGICVCTNHFRTATLAVFPWCRRYRQLDRSRRLDTLDVSDLAEKLHDVNQGPLTVQTMIFEPVPLKLHLAIGSCPSSALPMKLLELAPLLTPAGGD